MSTPKSSDSVAAGHGKPPASAVAPKVLTGQARTDSSSQTPPVASGTPVREQSPSASSTSSGRYPEEPPRPETKHGVVLRDPKIEESPMETLELYLIYTTRLGVDPEVARKRYMCRSGRKGKSIDPHKSLADSSSYWTIVCFDRALRWQLLDEKDEPTKIVEMHSN